jgi:hypothetical protein
VIALALALSLAQLPGDLDGPIFSNPATMGGASLAFFEFAPASGVGMGEACACVAPTGAKGEALTFTRNSTAYCTKTPSDGLTTFGGLSTEGIANGDLVLCSANQPRVEYDSAGTKGLLVEGARTNYVLRSQELDNASWSLQSAGCGATSRTANAGTAPDGTLTAEQIDVPACTAGAGRYSAIYTTSAFAMSAASWSVSFYAKGVSGSGTVYAALTPDGVTYLSGTVVCSFVSDSWTRCTGTVTATLTNYYLVIGSDHRDPSQTTDNPAASVYIWGVQAELGAYATSYIPTTSGTAARQYDSPTFTFSAPVSTAAGASWATTSTVGGFAGSGYSIELYQDASNRPSINYNSATQATCQYISTGGNAAPVATVPNAINTATRIGCSWTPAPLTTINAGGTSSSSSAASSSMSWASAFIGGSALFTSVRADGIVSKVCVDPSPTKCAQ